MKEASSKSSPTRGEGDLDTLSSINVVELAGIELTLASVQITVYSHILSHISPAPGQPTAPFQSPVTCGTTGPGETG